ncbi:MAG: hypothetical protein J0I44_12150, partial [Microbacterium sp.]|nr:hypothetical protein [Microbacterium sp.]
MATVVLNRRNLLVAGGSVLAAGASGLVLPAGAQGLAPTASMSGGANNYIKALEGLAKSPNQKVLMLPVEAASVIGAIGGIAEIAKETFGGERPAATPPRGSGRPPS